MYICEICGDEFEGEDSIFEVGPDGQSPAICPNCRAELELEGDL